MNLYISDQTENPFIHNLKPSKKRKEKTMSNKEHLVEAHVMKYEFHLKHIDKRIEK